MRLFMTVALLLGTSTGRAYPGLFALTGLLSISFHPLFADIGVVDTGAPKTAVLYEDGGKVYLKICKPPVAPPLTRDCENADAPKQVTLNVYLSDLPYDLGGYPKTEAGLRIVEKVLDDAQKGGAPESVINRLKEISGHLRKILSVREELKATQQNLTYYEYQEEFSQLQVPFEKKTQSGYVFTRDRSNPKLGEAWRDPSGMIWGDIVKQDNGSPRFMIHGDATDYCKSIGASLPSSDDFIRLREYMGARPGSFYAEGYTPQVLPNLTYTKGGKTHPRFFWSSMFFLFSPASADIFNGHNGDFYYDDRDFAVVISVRCLARGR